jgi:hypothetical protein
MSSNQEAVTHFSQTEVNIYVCIERGGGLIKPAVDLCNSILGRSNCRCCNSISQIRELLIARATRAFRICM